MSTILKSDIPYVTDGDEYRLGRCKLDLQIPEGAKDFPTVVWFHGGGLFGGSKHFIRIDESIAQVAVNYRLMSLEKNVIKGTDCIRDAAEAVAWTLKHIAEYGGDPKKVFVSGLSAGAYLAMMVGMDSRWLAEFGYSNNDLAGIAPVSGQATKHFYIRQCSYDNQSLYLPKIDDLAPLAHCSGNLPPIISICGAPPYEIRNRAEENRLMISSCNAQGHPDAKFVQLDYCDHVRAYTAGVPFVEMFILNHMPSANADAVKERK